MNKTVVHAIVKSGITPKSNETREEIQLLNSDGSAFTGRNLSFAPITTGTAIGTAAKTTTSPEPAANTLVPIKFTNGNTAASPTVAFNGGTARAIKLGGTASAAAEITVAANGIVFFFFDGTDLHQLGVTS